MPDKKTSIPSHTVTLVNEIKKPDWSTYNQYIELWTAYISEKNGTIPVKIPKGISIHGWSTLLVSPLTEKRKEIILSAIEAKKAKQEEAQEDDETLPF